MTEDTKKPARAHVLVVEDSPRLQRTLGLALRKSGYAVDVATDGEEGLCAPSRTVTT